MTNDKTVTIRLPEDLVIELSRFREDFAAKHGVDISKSKSVRVLLRKALDLHWEARDEDQAV